MDNLISNLSRYPKLEWLVVIGGAVALFSYVNRELRKPHNRESIVVVANMIFKVAQLYMSQSYKVGPLDTRTRKLSFWMLAAVQCMLAAFCITAIFAVGISWGLELHGCDRNLAAVLVPGIFTLVMGPACAYHICHAHAIRSAILGVPLAERFRLPLNGGT